MRKHVAATLYGIGVRLDEDPSLFFTLRKVDMTELVGEAVEETTDKLLKKAKGKRKGVIADADIASVFGIVMEDTTSFDAAELPKPERSVRRPVSGPRTVSAASGRKKKTTDDRKRVLDLVARSKTGIDVPSLKKKTGLDTARIRNIVYAAFKKGDIDRSGRGLYKGKGAPVDPAKEADVIMALIRQSPKGIGISSIKRATGMPDARVRYVISRAYGKGAIERVSRGVYTAVEEDVAPEKPTDAVLKIIKDSKKGMAVSGLVKKSGFGEKKIRNILYRLNKLGKIKRKKRGLYIAAGKR
jgi:predicted transcriptional regulator of viral defense system